MVTTIENDYDRKNHDWKRLRAKTALHKKTPQQPDQALPQQRQMEESNIFSGSEDSPGKEKVLECRESGALHRLLLAERAESVE